MPPCLICITNNSIREARHSSGLQKVTSLENAKNVIWEKKKRISARPQNSPIQPSPLTLSLLFCPWYIRQWLHKTQKTVLDLIWELRAHPPTSRYLKNNNYPSLPRNKGFPGDGNFRAKTRKSWMNQDDLVTVIIWYSSVHECVLWEIPIIIPVNLLLGFLEELIYQFAKMSLLRSKKGGI